MSSLRERLAAGARRARDRATNQRREEPERQVERKANAEPQQRDRRDGSDVDHGRTSPESDEEDEMFRRAEDAATMGSPIEATIDPVTSPQGMEKLARGRGGAGEDPDDLGLFGGESSDGMSDDGIGVEDTLGVTSNDPSPGLSSSNPLAVDDKLGVSPSVDDEGAGGGVVQYDTGGLL